MKVIRPALAGIALCGRTSSTTGKHRGRCAARPDPANIKILAGDVIEAGGIGNLADRRVQHELDPCLDGIDLSVLDNLPSLTSMIRDNDAESGGTIQECLLRVIRRAILNWTPIDSCDLAGWQIELRGSRYMPRDFAVRIFIVGDDAFELPISSSCSVSSSKRIQHSAAN